jgi:transposase
MSEVLDVTNTSAGRGKGTRRSWSRVEKRRIVEEAFRPGASVAGVARNYGLNANQVLNWRRRAATVATKAQNAASAARVREISATPAATFLPSGMIVQTTDDRAAPVSPSAVPEIGSAVVDRPPAAYATLCQPSGRIEIDLACGTRLRVDAFVDEHALRRVLSVLKTSS